MHCINHYDLKCRTQVCSLLQEKYAQGLWKQFTSPTVATGFDLHPQLN